MEIRGNVFKILPEQSGEGKNGRWVKQGFVIDVAEQKFPKKAYFTAWGDQADQIKKLQMGAAVKVSFDVESREFNEKWYTDLRAWRIDVENAAVPGAAPAAVVNDLPADMDVTFTDTGDDLPF